MMDGKVDQDVREGAIWLAKECNPDEAEWIVPYYEQGGSSPLTEILARMKETGRQAGLREAAEAMREAIARGYNAPEVKCEHGRYGWEDCIACYDDALENAITALIEPAPCPPPPASS